MLWILASGETRLPYRRATPEASLTGFVGPDEHDKREMGSPEEHDTHATNGRRGEEQSHGSDAQ